MTPQLSTIARDLKWSSFCESLQEVAKLIMNLANSATVPSRRCSRISRCFHPSSSKHNERDFFEFCSLPRIFRPHCSYMLDNPADPQKCQPQDTHKCCSFVVLELEIINLVITLLIVGCYSAHFCLIRLLHQETVVKAGNLMFALLVLIIVHSLLDKKKSCTILT